MSGSTQEGQDVRRCIRRRARKYVLDDEEGHVGSHGGGRWCRHWDGAGAETGTGGGAIAGVGPEAGQDGESVPSDRSCRRARR